MGGSTDNVGVAGYDVDVRSGTTMTKVGTTADKAFTVAGLSPNTQYASRWSPATRPANTAQVAADHRRHAGRRHLQGTFAVGAADGSASSRS